MSSTLEGGVKPISSPDVEEASVEARESAIQPGNPASMAAGAGGIEPPQEPGKGPETDSKAGPRPVETRPEGEGQAEEKASSSGSSLPDEAPLQVVPADGDTAEVSHPEVLQGAAEQPAPESKTSSPLNGSGEMAESPSVVPAVAVEVLPAAAEKAGNRESESEEQASGALSQSDAVNGSGERAESVTHLQESASQAPPADEKTADKESPEVVNSRSESPGSPVEAVPGAKVDSTQVSETPASRRAVIKAASENGSPVEGKVVAIVRGGFEVDLGSVIALCPFSQIDLIQSSDQLIHLHKTYAFKISSYKRGGRRILLSRRVLLQREARQALREAQRQMKAGAVEEGTVISLTDFGAFVDIKGMQGMIHVSEISHERISKPSQRLKVGEIVRVKILKSDRRRGRLSLSMKALEEDPWKQAGSQLRQRQVVEGRKARLTEFGIFVEVLPGIEGLLHLSEIPDEKMEATKTLVSEGGELPVLILSVELGKRRISLALPPEGTRPGDRVDFMSLKPGNIVAGVVSKVDASGVHVRLGPGRTGLVSPVETGASRDADLKKLFHVDQEVTALVMGAERGGGGRRARLSIRKAQRREERKQIDDYRRSAASGAGSFATLGDFFTKS